MKIHILSETFEKLAGLRTLLAELELQEDPQGIPLSIEPGEAMSIDWDGTRLNVTYTRPVEVFRALCLFKGHHSDPSFNLRERAAFDRNGLMLDCSRNQAPTVETVKYLLSRMALMGLSLAMLYTEDTYEVPGEPYFGYLRGRFSQAELRELDDYADALGIEMIPCIQTLSHLNRVLHWPCYQPVRDTQITMLVDEEATYALIEKMVTAISACFRSRRIHIGMDEAWDLGDGRYREIHGGANRHEMMVRHVARVYAICEKLGLTPMMWSDMHFLNAFGSYYASDRDFPAEVAESVNKQVGLVYWDYYAEDIEKYRRMIALHRQLGAPLVFAGGIWIWGSGLPDYVKTFNTTVKALTACRESGVREVFATVWNDDSDGDLRAALPGMQLFAEMDYTGSDDMEVLAARLRQSCGVALKDFMDVTAMDYAPGVHYAPGVAGLLHKNLLYEDPLIPMFERDFEGIPLENHYAELLPGLKNAAAVERPLQPFFQYAYRLCEALKLKCAWRNQAAQAVRANNRDWAKELVTLAEENMRCLHALKDAWREMWLSGNKPYGYEVIDLRMGGLIGRFASAAVRMNDFASGTLADIPELSCPKRRCCTDENGLYAPRNGWENMVSACRMFGCW